MKQATSSGYRDTMWGRGSRAVFVVLLAALLFSVATPARAASSAVCTASNTFTLTPGVTLATIPFAFSTADTTGTLDCHGPVNGQQVTGLGTFTNEGVANGSCAQGRGYGRIVAKIPTDRGSVSMTAEYTLQWLGILGTLSSPQFSGTFQFLPVKGDCVGTPLTESLFLLQGVVTT